MLQLSLGHGGKSTHECLSAERSKLMNVETEPGIWRGIHSSMFNGRKVTAPENCN